MSLTTTSLAPQTALEAVNELLATVRLAPVLTLLDADLTGDAQEAMRCLNDACIEAQKVGWLFNTEIGLALTPDTAGEVYLPANTLKVRGMSCPAHEPLAQRGLRLYAPIAHTYAIGANVTADVVVALPFEECPTAARAYITALAARKFAPPRLPTGATFRYTDDALAAALSDLEQEDSSNRLDTLVDTSPHFSRMARR